MAVFYAKIYFFWENNNWGTNRKRKIQIATKNQKKSNGVCVWLWNKLDLLQYEEWRSAFLSSLFQLVV